MSTYGQLTVALATSSDAFRASLAKAAQAVEGFCVVMVTPLYAQAHGGRLPGSTRTARLRKKRRDAVLRWWRDA